MNVAIVTVRMCWSVCMYICLTYICRVCIPVDIYWSVHTVHIYSCENIHLVYIGVLLSRHPAGIVLLMSILHSSTFHH